MPSLMVSSALMKARFAAFNITLDSVVPAPGSGPRVGAGLPGPTTGTMAANRPQTVAGTTAGNRPSVSGLGSAPPPPARPTGTPMQCPPALFRAATNDKVDCEYQKSMHDELNKFFDAIAQGFVHGMNQWKMQAGFSGVVINGPTAVGGRIESPYLDSHVITGTTSAFGGAMTGWADSLMVGAARGFANKWKELCDQTRVPGLPWYPAFAAFPGPAAPPMPNIPTPFMTLATPAWLIAPGSLKDEMKRKAPAGTLYADQVFTAVSEQLSAGLTLWMALQQVLGAMGKGPCPAFAPPYVPVSPVVMGEILSNSRPFMA